MKKLLLGMFSLFLLSTPVLAEDSGWQPFGNDFGYVDPPTRHHKKHHRVEKTPLRKEASRPTRQSNPLAEIPIIGSLFQVGTASFYHEPQALASGGRFNPEAMTAAHKTLPFGTRVRVTNKRNGRSVVVTINDRGPYVGGRIIDLSKGAARAIGMLESGTAPVTIEKV